MTMRDSDQSISNSDMSRLRTLIYTQSGINLSAEKKTMLELRLRPRLRVLTMNSYREYCDYLFSGRGQREEIVPLLDAVTTNKTDFFREPGHFEYLTEASDPGDDKTIGSGRTLLVWSAGCSSGEEPYTLSMVLSEYAVTIPGFVSGYLPPICAPPCSKRPALRYSAPTVTAPVPAALRRKYFLRSRDSGSKQMRVVPELRTWLSFAASISWTPTTG